MATPPPSPADHLTPHTASRLLRSLAADDAQPTPNGLPNIPGYRIVEAIGQGGGGSVYRAFRDGSDRPAAIKIIRDIASEVGLQRARRELEMLESLRLPCVPHILDYGIHEGRLFFAEDFVDGDHLDDYAAKLPPGEVRGRVALLAKTARAVQTLHEHAVIHRDLKPANILVTPQGDVMIVDFGLAFHADAPIATISQTDSPIGTPAFMAPEQARGERAAISTRTDVYALGASAYQILTGHTPHDTHTSIHEAIRRVAFEPPREPRTLRADLPKPLAAVLGKACARSPEARYASAAEFATDLERWCRGEAVEATTPGAWQRVMRWAGRRPKTATALACAMMVAVTFAMTSVSVWWVMRVPYEVVRVWSEDSPSYIRQARLLSRAGNILREWTGARSEIIDALFVNRPKELGGGSVVLIASHLGDQPGIHAYDADHPYRAPIWTIGTGPEGFTIPLREGANYLPIFDVKMVEVLDIFTDAPGPEIVAIHNHKPDGLATIRVYDLAGQVLYEAWHLGHFSEFYWVKGEKLLILRGHNNEVSWECRGQSETRVKWPIVVLALRPVRGERCGWIATPSAPGDVRPDWYKCLLPAAGIGDQATYEGLDVGPAASSPAETQGHDLARLFSISTLHVTIYYDAQGREIGRQNWTTTKLDPSTDGTPPVNPDTIHLGELPPIVEGCGEGER